MRSDPFVVGLLVGALVGGVIVVVGLVVAFTRKSSLAQVGRTRRMRQLQSSLPPHLALARIIEGTPAHGFVVEEHAPGKGALLSTKPTFTSWGFFYPVFVSPRPGGSLIEIGIASKFVQVGPLVTSAHKRATQAVERVLGEPAAG